MTPRERFLAVMRFEPFDHVPDEEFGYWSDTIRAWQEQGLPREVDDNGKADRFFGFEPRGHVPVHVGLRPHFSHEVLEETDRYVIVRDGEGTVQQVFRDGTSSIPKYLSHAVSDRTSWEEFKRRLNATDDGRYPANWDELAPRWRDRDYALGVSMGSMWGWIRNWMGFEAATTVFYEDPGLARDMTQHLTEFYVTVIERAARDVDLDFASGWEDMCFRSGPMVSPKLFEEYLVPGYARIAQLLKQHGVDIIYIDCDGNINELVPLWLKAGVRGMFPLERGPGSDPRPMRDKYGKEVLLFGGVDKHALREGKAAIRKAVQEAAELAAEGGYIPHVDHRVPPDVTYENYLYYLEAKREALGIPTPEGYLERVVEPASNFVNLRPEENLGVTT